MSESYKQIQNDTFCGWINSKLASEHINVRDLNKELKDGVVLSYLLEGLTKEQIPDIIDFPNSDQDGQENLERVFAVIIEKNVELAEDITAENVRMQPQDCAIRLIWSLIEHYEIHHYHLKPTQTSSTESKDLLLGWVQSMIPEMNTKNLNSDWHDGTRIYALVRKLSRDGSLPAEPQGDAESFVTKAFKVADRRLGIPTVLAPRDLTNPSCEEHSIMTMLALMRSSVTDSDDLRRPSMPGPALPPREYEDTYDDDPSSQGNYDTVKERYNETYEPPPRQAPVRLSSHRAQQRQQYSRPSRQMVQYGSSRGSQGRRPNYPWKKHGSGDVVVRKEIRKFIEYEIDLPGWGGKVWTAPTNGPKTARYFPANIMKCSKLAARAGLHGPVWVLVCVETFEVLSQRGDSLLCVPLHHVQRFGKDVDVLSVQIGDINDRYYGCLYFHTNRADDAFETIHRYSMTR